jgi:hypothetical protein
LQRVAEAQNNNYFPAKFKLGLKMQGDVKKLDIERATIFEASQNSLKF